MYKFVCGFGQQWGVGGRGSAIIIRSRRAGVKPDVDIMEPRTLREGLISNFVICEQYHSSLTNNGKHFFFELIQYEQNIIYMSSKI